MTALTLISSVLNGMPYLDDMLASVDRSRQAEHLVIDAGSTDGTLGRLRGRRRLKLIERPGLPLYAAWNEAVRTAKSPWVAFLNADDLLPQGALAVMLKATAKPGNFDVFCGEAEAFSGSPHRPDIVLRYSGEALTGLDLPVLTFGAALLNAKLIRRKLILKLGGFDETFAFASDREFLLRLALKRPGLAVHRMPALLYRYRIHPGSKTLKQSAARRLEIAQEHRRIAEQYLALPGLERQARTVLRAWAAHETAVTLARGLRAQAEGGFRLAAPGPRPPTWSEGQVGGRSGAGGALGRLLLSGPRAVADLARAVAIRRRYRAALQAVNGPAAPFEWEAAA